jgi:hypothetical protein
MTAPKFNVLPGLIAEIEGLERTACLDHWRDIFGHWSGPRFFGVG